MKHSGALCFVSPNAWLDIDYGRELQSFLLDKAILRGIINPSHRGFTAGINTIITVAARRDTSNDYSFEEQVRFVKS